MGRLSSFGQHLYTGRVSFDFVGRRLLWYAISAVLVLGSAAGLGVNGLERGIDFKGGVEFTAQVSDASSASVDRLREAVIDTGLDAASSPVVNTSGDSAIRVQTSALTQDETSQVADALASAGATEVSQNLVGPSWGAEVAKKAATGLVVFLVIVVLFIWAYFREWRMSVAAMVALAHDLVITVGIYAWSGFEVTPATVTGLLTILGYSLYDTVVVFDKVRENTRGITASTSRLYAEQANLAVNQTLVRSINTSITALLPVGALLIVGVGVLGSGPLKDLALALFVGMAVGTYSSIFIATPIAVQLKERDPAIREHTAKVLKRRAKELETPDAVAPATARPVATSAAAGRRQPQRSSRQQRRGR
ncbi:protein translocase subunit SecF [Aeromicrobium sp.]|uniref:protein translocase subunit SecF n=1 Tax=Aeromicrobium sp. TaxID=1871063 RepID=UPI0025C40FA7|nr:protein translocase subunit SecF [Aeromicrobium sp.]MCK5891214.1 protein translocase subunit SecF [Aeromicrobium sp.]